MAPYVAVVMTQCPYRVFDGVTIVLLVYTYHPFHPILLVFQCEGSRVRGNDKVVWGIAGQLSQRSVDVTKEHHILLVELDGLFSAVSYAFASVFAYP